jgi:REP element-mobilizing transposase RayT
MFPDREGFDDNTFPLAYLLTFRTYGTWLHGDARGSVQRRTNNRYGGPKITPSVPLTDAMSEARKEMGFLLDAQQRKSVELAIIEVCEYRRYLLHALNVLPNHGHAVVSAQLRPEKIVNDFKAYATRRLRKEWLVSADERVWSRGASTRYLWKAHHVDGAIDYVKYCQEDIPFEFRD